MASTQIYPRSRDGVNALLTEGDRLKEYATKVTEKYVESPENPLGSLDPSLATSGPLVPVKSTDRTVALSGSSPVQGQTGTDIIKLEVEVEREEDGFKKAMREYEKTAKEKYKTGIDPDGEHTVEQLETVITESIDQYQTKDTKGFWGKIRFACRKLGDDSDNIQGWLGLLPTESHYLSVVAGGLKLILKAAARMRNVAEKVLDALQQIPVILGTAQRVLNIYKDSEKLKELSQTFYLSILAALGHILHYLRRKSSSKVFQVTLQPASFQKDLLDKIDKIAKARDAVNEEADLCHQEMQEKSYQLAHAADKNSESILREVSDIKQVLLAASTEERRANGVMRDAFDLLQMNNAEIRKIGQDVAAMPMVMQTMVQTVMQKVMQTFQANQALEKLAEQRLMPLDTADSSSDWESDRRRSVGTIARFKKTILSSNQQRRTLLSQLNYNSSTIVADLAANYKHGMSLSSDDEERAIFVIKSPKLSSWVTAEQSTILIINGNSGSSQRRSAMSFINARLIYTLEKIRSSAEIGSIGKSDIIPLYFFCGQHAAGDHSWETPVGILNSLLAQLLTQYKDLDLQKTIRLGTFNNDDFKAVFKRFESILSQLPSTTTVFCILDGLSFYLTDENLEDAEELIHRFVKLVKGESHRKPSCVLKILLAAPNRFHPSEISGLRSSQILTAPANPPHTGGFNSMKWTSGVGKQLKNLETLRK